MRSLILIGIAILLSIGVAQAGDWPMYMHDISHSGNSYEIVEPPLKLLWEYETGGSASSHSPAISGGVVYVGSNDNNVYALDATTGTLKWKYATEGSVYSSPAVSGGIVYVGSYDNNVYALDATTGTLKWKYTTGSWIDSSPAVSGGVVYVGSLDYNVYALDAATGSLKWKYTTGDSVLSSPAVSNGVVYVGSYDNNVYALDIVTGMLIWKYKTGDLVRSSPSISQGVVYVGSNDNNVYALDATTGSLKWKYTTGGGVESSPAVSDNMVYIGSRDSNVYALDATTGALKWKYKTRDEVDSSPAISGGVVYVGSLDYNVYALDAATGSLKWKYKTGGYLYSSPVVSGSVVYVVSQKYSLFSSSFSTVHAFESGINWITFGGTILAMLLIGIIALLLRKLKESTPKAIEKLQQKPVQSSFNKLIIVILAILVLGGLVWAFFPTVPPKETTQIQNTITSTTQESTSNIVQHPSDYDGKTVTVNGQVIISPNPGNYIIDGNSGIKLEGNLPGLSEGFYKLTGIYNAEKNTLTIQNSTKLEGTPASVDDAFKLPNPFVAVKVQGLAASPPAFVENKLNSYIAIPGSPIEEIHTYVIYNKDGLYLIVNPHKSPQLNFSEATVVGTLIKAPPDKLKLGKDFVPTDFKGIIIANEITQVNPIPATVKEINQNPENYAFKRVVIDGIYATGSGKLGYGKDTVKEDLRIHLGAGLMADEFLPDDTSKLIVSIDPVYTDWQIRRGKVTGTIIYPTKEILQYFAQKGMNEVKEVKPVLIVESISEDLVSVKIEDLITDLLKNNGQKYNGKVVNITGYALGANVPVKEVAEKVARAYNQGLGEVVKMIPADVNVQGTAIADSPTPVMGQLPLAGLNSELIEKTQLMAGKYNFKVVVTVIDNKPMLFLVHKEKLPFTMPTAIPTQIPTVIPTAIPTLPSLPTSTPTPSLPTPTATPTLPLPTPTLPKFP